MMVSLTTLLVLILSLSFFVFVAFFGRLPALRRTPIAALHRLIWVHIPKAVLAVDQRLTSGRLTKSMFKFGNYLMYDRHPTIVIFFLLILTVSEYLYLPEVWPQIGWFTKITAAITVVMPYTFLYLACASDPGYITPQTHAYYLSLYPYDHALFHPGHECSTCRLLKPARSKHCSTCKRCVAKADHHCIFINSCVGYGNHHWFLLLLFSTGLLTTYGGFLGLSLLSATTKQHFPLWSVWPPEGMTYKQYALIWGWGIQRNVSLGATTLLSLLTSPLVWGLFFYTVWLVYCGTTTNESLKWSEWKEDMDDGYAFRRILPADRERNLRVEPQCDRWPVQPEHILVATGDGNAPHESAPLQGQGRWEHIWNLRHAENLYDLGFWDNIVDIFVPNYAFGNRTDEPLAERRNRMRQTTNKKSGFPP